MAKSWDDVGYTRRQEIMRELAANYRCPECDGTLHFVGKEQRTIVLHELWCSIPVRFHRLRAI